MLWCIKAIHSNTSLKKHAPGITEKETKNSKIKLEKFQTCSCTPSTLHVLASVTSARTPPTIAISTLHLSSAARFASAPAARSCLSINDKTSTFKKILILCMNRSLMGHTRTPSTPDVHLKIRFTRAFTPPASAMAAWNKSQQDY